MDNDRNESTSATGGTNRPSSGAVSARRLERDGDRIDVQRSDAEPSAPSPGLISDPGRYQARWTDVQVAFVDAPREAVREADALVADVIQELVDGFSSERRELEAQWDRGDDVSTEQLRVALQRYRSFFDRLLAT